MLVAENEDSKILLSPGQGVKVKQWSSNVVKLTKADLGDFLVARDARRLVVGRAALHRHFATLAEILVVAVLPAFQGRGIGVRLIQQCETWRRAVASSDSGWRQISLPKQAKQGPRILFLLSYATKEPQPYGPTF